MNLFEKMAAITADMDTVAKNLTVETTKGRGYKAVSERDIIDAVKPLEAKHRVYSYPFSRELVESEILESESTYEGKTTKKTTFYTHLRTVYRFVDIDAPDTYIDMCVYSVGLDTQDKGDGKAMTYGDKYALMKAYKISTGDDPDQEASADNDYQRKASYPQQRRQTSTQQPDLRAVADRLKQQRPEVTQAAPTVQTPPQQQSTPTIAPDGDFQPTCADCGCAISVKVHDYSAGMFGKPLCMKCQKNHAR